MNFFKPLNVQLALATENAWFNLTITESPYLGVGGGSPSALFLQPGFATIWEIDPGARQLDNSWPSWKGQAPDRVAKNRQEPLLSASQWIPEEGREGGTPLRISDAGSNLPLR